MSEHPLKTARQIAAAKAVDCAGDRLTQASREYDAAVQELFDANREADEQRQRDGMEEAAKEHVEELRQLRNQVEDLRSYADACRKWFEKSPIALPTPPQKQEGE